MKQWIEIDHTKLEIGIHIFWNGFWINYPFNIGLSKFKVVSLSKFKCFGGVATPQPPLNPPLNRLTAKILNIFFSVTNQRNISVHSLIIPHFNTCTRSKQLSYSKRGIQWLRSVNGPPCLWACYECWEFYSPKHEIVSNQKVTKILTMFVMSTGTMKHLWCVASPL